MIGVYAFLAEAIGPALARIMLSRNPKLDGKTLPERLGRRGLPESLPDGRRIWLNAASVGESVALLPFVNEWKIRHPEDHLFFTNTTVTGFDKAKELFAKEAAWRGFFPLDVPSAVRSAVSAVKPSAFITVEAEAWPNFLNELGKRGVPRILINGRMTLANKRGLKRLITSRIWRMFDLVIARSEADRDAFLGLGIADGKLRLSGELKLDVATTFLSNEDKARLAREYCLNDCTVWIAASSHRGEEELVLKTHAALLGQYPALKLILVPRHPERFDEAAAIIEKSSLPFHRFSGGPGGRDKPVLLVDAMGKLAAFYQICGLAVVCGSFLGPGVHSVIEPAAYGLPVITGPRTFNTDIPGRMAALGALKILASQAELPNVIESWAKEIACGQNRYFFEMGGRARSFIESNKGASARTADFVATLLG